MQIIRNAPPEREKAGIIEVQDLPRLCGRESPMSGQEENDREHDFGLAVDIGTTTVAVSLYQLRTKKYLGGRQERNRQTGMGSDVMMRLMHCQRGHQGALQRMLTEQLEQLADAVSEGNCRLDDITKMTVVGNPSMCHIFAGQDISGLTGSPFRPSYQGALRCRGEMLGFKRLSQTEIYILPGIDAHVGADAVSMITALGMDRRKGIQMAVDIGTNAEMALQDSEGRLLTCSVPAGPAFEGMEISCGVRGEEGAVAGFRFAPQAGNIILNVISSNQNDGSLPLPKGLCGSGLIDAVAQLLQHGLLEKDGYLLSAQEAAIKHVPDLLVSRLVETDGERGVILYQAGDREASVILTQQDIRQFQLAKAAVQAGIKVLLSSRSILLEQVEQIWIAGVFGGHISRRSAVQTGLFPDVPVEKLSVVGNAAAQGAALALLSPKFRQSLEQVAGKAEHLELASSEAFKREYMAAMEL